MGLLGRWRECISGPCRDELANRFRLIVPWILRSCWWSTMVARQSTTSLVSIYLFCNSSFCLTFGTRPYLPTINLLLDIQTNSPQRWHLPSSIRRYTCYTVHHDSVSWTMLQASMSLRCWLDSLQCCELPASIDRTLTDEHFSTASYRHLACLRRYVLTVCIPHDDQLCWSKLRRWYACKWWTGLHDSIRSEFHWCFELEWLLGRNLPIDIGYLTRSYFLCWFGDLIWGDQRVTW